MFYCKEFEIFSKNFFGELFKWKIENGKWKIVGPAVDNFIRFSP